MAIEYENYNYSFVLNIIKNKMIDYEEPQMIQNLPNHENIRGKDYYNNQLSLNFK